MPRGPRAPGVQPQGGSLGQPASTSWGPATLTTAPPSPARPQALPQGAAPCPPRPPPSTPFSGGSQGAFPPRSLHTASHNYPVPCPDRWADASQPDHLKQWTEPGARTLEDPGPIWRPQTGGQLSRCDWVGLRQAPLNHDMGVESQPARQQGSAEGVRPGGLWTAWLPAMRLAVPGSPQATRPASQQSVPKVSPSAADILL